MNSKEWNEWKGEETSLDRELDDVLAQAMEVSVPEGLIDGTLKHLPELGSAPFAWWAWALYVAFFTTAVTGLVYWEWETLVAAMTRGALVVPKIVALVAQYPYVALAVVGAFFVNALVMWLVAADLVVRKRLAGVTVS
jgi:hypothetical protein